jgi:hypothetical protein
MKKLLLTLSSLALISTSLYAGCTADVVMDGNQIKGLGAPTTGTDAVNRDYVDDSIGSLNKVLSKQVALGQIFANHTGTRYVLLAKSGDSVGFIMAGTINTYSFTDGKVANFYARKLYNSNAMAGSLTGVSSLGSSQIKILQVTTSGVSGFKTDGNAVSVGDGTYLALKITGGIQSVSFNALGDRINDYMISVTNTSGVTDSTEYATY